MVQKFGGSSVASVEKIQHVAELVTKTRRSGHDVVVVVSAMGKSTDELLALAQQVDDNPPRRELDMLLSTGERVSMALMSMAIQKQGCSAISFTGSQSGIITNDRHFDARIIDVRPHRVEDELSRGKVVILAGYQGMSYKREITTLGRGGSDTTALAMAAALSAERAEIYSDVDGVYTADPRVVKDAKHLPEISYDEMQEMATSGAKVLHSQAVEFAKHAGISIRARSTFSPGRETVVHDHADQVRTVVGKAGVIKLESKDLLPLNQLSILRLQRDHNGYRVWVDAKNTPDVDKTLSTLPSDCNVQTGLAMVSVVGRGIQSDESVLRAINSHGKVDPAWNGAVSVDGMKAWTVLSENHCDELVKKLHEDLVG